MDRAGRLLIAAGVLGGLLLLWLALVVALWTQRPDDLRIRDALRLLPDLVRMLRRLAADPDVPRGVRVRLWLLLGHLLSPIDLVPDVIPVQGYADDAVVVALALRSVARHAGPEALDRHWPEPPTDSARPRPRRHTRPMNSIRPSPAAPGGVSPERRAA